METIKNRIGQVEVLWRAGAKFWKAVDIVRHAMEVEAGLERAKE